MHTYLLTNNNNTKELSYTSQAAKKIEFEIKVFCLIYNKSFTLLFYLKTLML